MKKIISLTLALAIVLSMSVCAFATQTLTAEGNQKVDLIGEIKKGDKLISVVMPTSLSFQVGTTDDTNLAENKSATTATTTGVKFASFAGTSADVTNNSSAAIKVSLASVTDDQGLTTKMDLFLYGKTNEATKKALTTETKNVVLIDNIAAYTGVETLTVAGSAAKAADASDADIALPLGAAKVTTTLKVELVEAE